jgi:hypothetical protein
LNPRSPEGAAGAARGSAGHDCADRANNEAAMLDVAPALAPTTRSPGERYCRRKPGAPAIGPRLCCGSPPARWAKPTPHWVHSTADYRRGWGKPRRSPPPRARSLFSSTIRFATACLTSIPVRAYYEDRYKQRVLKNLQRRAKSLGFVLQPSAPDIARTDVS